MTSGDEGQGVAEGPLDEGQDAVPDVPRTRVYFLPDLFGHGMFGSPDQAARDEIAEGVMLEWEAKWED